MGGHCRYLKTDPGHLGTEGTYGPHHQPTDQHTAAPASNHKRRASLAQRYAANTSRFTDSPLTVTTFTHLAWARVAQSSGPSSLVLHVRLSGIISATRPVRSPVPPGQG